MGKEVISENRLDNRRHESQDSINKLQGASILLVEDNELNQELAQELLEQNGLSVTLANNGLEALGLLREFSYDAVLMDLQMPVMDGYEATTRIRQQETLKELVVIAMTANAMARDRKKVIEVGMNDHIAKPINVDEMFKTLAKWVTPKHPLLSSRITPEQPKNIEPVESQLELPGIDTEAGLAISQGNHKLYLKLLNKFHTSQADFFERFSQARINEDDPQAAQRCAHSLRGVAGNIGANALMKVATELEEACMEAIPDPDIDNILFKVCTLLDQVLNSLASVTLTHERKIEKNQSFDQDSFLKLLQKLKLLLQDDDTDAIDVVDELYQLPGVEKYSSALKQLAKAIESYDFELGLEILNDLKQ